MKLESYLFTVNKNNSCKLDLDELKDVAQEIRIYLERKDYNDDLTRKTIKAYYLSACKKKDHYAQKLSNAKYDQDQYEPPAEFDLLPGAQDIDEQRMQQVNKLTLTSVQKKIVKRLIKGMDYDAIGKELHLKKKQLYNHVCQIRQHNT